ANLTKRRFCSSKSLSDLRNRQRWTRERPHRNRPSAAPTTASAAARAPRASQLQKSTGGGSGAAFPITGGQRRCEPATAWPRDLVAVGHCQTHEPLPAGTPARAATVGDSPSS